MRVLEVGMIGFYVAGCVGVLVLIGVGAAQSAGENFVRDRMWPWLRDVLTLFFVLFAVGTLLAMLAAAAGATTVKTGWQIHVFYANSDRKVTIGPPFPTKQLCEEVRFPVMIELIGDRVECVPVVDRYNVD